MTLDLLLKLLRTHWVALQSPAWPRPHGVSNGPALYLDAADTSALITELVGIQRKVEAAHLGGAVVGGAESQAARSIENMSRDFGAGEPATGAPAPSDTRMDELVQEFDC
jgi:hypothetical protein